MRKLMQRCRQVLFTGIPPQCFFCFSYVSLSRDRALRLHRQLFFSNFKCSLQGMGQLIILFRWLSYGVWVSAWRISTKLSSEKQQEYGVSRRQVFKDLLRWGYLHTLSPHDYFLYALYNKENYPWFMHYVYHQELPHFHYVSLRGFKTHPEAIRLIANKTKFTQMLSQRGLPTVQTICYPTARLKANLSLLHTRKNIFCKPNQASNSQDAFLLAYDETADCYRIEPVHQAFIHHPNAVARYLKKVCHRHEQLIVQPYLQDHDALAPYNQQPSCTTIRVITGKQAPQAAPQLLYLQLEIPKMKSKVGTRVQQLYDIFPLHWDTLVVDPVFQKKYPARCMKIQPISEPVKALLRQGIDACLRAHQYLLDLSSVGFDLVLTPDGPLILEANFNWSVACLYQVLEGDPLHYPHPAAHWLQSIFEG